MTPTNKARPTPERCKKGVWHGFHTYPCKHSAVRDGFCKQHHPDTAKARKERMNAKVGARLDALRRFDEQRKADALDAQRYRALRALVTSRADWPEPIRHHLTSNGVLRDDAVSETKLDAAIDSLTASHKDT